MGILGSEVGVVGGSRQYLRRRRNAAGVRGFPDDGGGRGGRAARHQARGADDDFAGMLLVGDLAQMGDRAAPLWTMATRRRHIELRLIEHVVRDVKAQTVQQDTPVPLFIPKQGSKNTP